MSGINERDFGTREAPVITDLEAEGSSPDKHTAMGLFKGMVQRLGEIVDVIDEVLTKLKGTVTVALDAQAPDTWSYAAASGGITGTADTTLHAAPSSSLEAGKRNYLESIQIINTDATVGTEVVVKDGSTILWRGFAPASLAAVTQPSVVPMTFQPPIRQPTPNAALLVACITTSSQTYVNAQGYVAE